AVWACRAFGGVAAVATALIIATTPPLLAHAGLATTDLPVTAMFLSSLFAFRLWLDRPNAQLGILVGATAALAVTAKLSALVFLPASFFCAMALRLLCGRQSEMRSWRSVEAVSGMAA